MIESSGPLLRGICNRCGNCCVIERDGETFVCDYLVQVDRLGQPFAATCVRYDARFHHMPITLTSSRGRQIAGSCAADGTDEEARAIIAKGIGRGCSLEVVA